MNPILAVEQGLPPGLWLPTAEEPTTQYEIGNFNRSDHDDETMVDFGGFVVALLKIRSLEEPRQSYMPREEDFIDVFRSGYGVSIYKINRYYGGPPKIQRSLGFYPDGFVPPRQEIIGRLGWMAHYAVDLEIDDFSPAKKVEEVIRWGTARDLLPARRIIYHVLGGDSKTIRKIFDPENPYAQRNDTFLDLYRLGAQVIREHGGPLKTLDFDRKYSHLFIGRRPSSVIRSFFGNTANFWAEFDYFPDAREISNQGIVDIGVRHAIRTGEVRLSQNRIKDLAKQDRFPSLQPIYGRLKGLTKFQERVEANYQRYLKLRETLIVRGISDEVIKLACRKFETSDGFKLRLQAHTQTLVTLSQDTISANCVRRRIKYGFNLADMGIFHDQFKDLNYAMKNLGKTGVIEKDFIFELIPRISVAEAKNTDFINGVRSRQSDTELWHDFRKTRGGKRRRVPIRTRRSVELDARTRLIIQR